MFIGGVDMSFLDISKIGFGMAVFLWLFSRVITGVLKLFSSRTGNVKLD